MQLYLSLSKCLIR